MNRSRPNPKGLRLAVLALAALAPGIPPCRAQADAGAPAKTHTLFMGEDFSVNRDGSFYRIRDVIGQSFVVLVGGRPVKVPMVGAPVKLKIEPSLKLTEAAAEVSDLKGQRAYTPQNDPMVKFNRTVVAGEAAYSESQMDTGDAQWRLDTFNAANAAHDSAGSATPASVYANGNPHAGGSMESNARDDLTSQLNSQVAVETAPQDNLGDPVGKDLFDAIEVSFEVASEKPLNNPFVVVLTRFRAPNARPGYVQNHIWAQALDPIGPTPKKVHILAGGLPPAYVLQGFQVHLYNEGQEVATNVAPQRVELTRDEAFEYLKMEYIGSHKGATLAAAPLMGRIPPDLSQRLGHERFSRTYFVRVTKDGLSAAAYTDESCSRPVDDPYLASVIRDFRFKPALKDGKPVEGVAPLKLNEPAI